MDQFSGADVPKVDAPITFTDQDFVYERRYVAYVASELAFATIERPCGIYSSVVVVCGHLPNL